MPPSRAQGCVQADYQQVIPNLQFTYCIMHKLHEWSKKCFGKGFGWICALNSARACTYHFLPYNSSGIDLFGMRTVQADSCFNSEQIDTLFISVEVRKGVLGDGSFWDGGCGFFFLRPLLIWNKSMILDVQLGLALAVFIPYIWQIYLGIQPNSVRADELVPFRFKS